MQSFFLSVIRKWFCADVKIACSFLAISKSNVAGDLASPHIRVDKYGMVQSDLSVIQRSLNIIRTQLAQTDAHTRLRALELMSDASKSIIANARKLSAPKQRNVPKQIPIPKAKTGSHNRNPNDTVGYLKVPKPTAEKPRSSVD